MVKICDFGLARDVYKDPDYVRKGDVSPHKLTKKKINLTLDRSVKQLNPHLDPAPGASPSEVDGP